MYICVFMYTYRKLYVQKLSTKTIFIYVYIYDMLIIMYF